MRSVSNNAISQGKLPKGVLIDEEDAHIINGYNKWNITKRGDVTTQKQYGSGSNRKVTTYRLHRVVMGVTDPSLEIDHINRNKLDNRKANLRVCSHSENTKNLSLKSNNSSGFPGVRWDVARKKWLARIKVDYREKHLGRFDNIEEAISARLFAESIYYAQFAPGRS